jgi:hypothetical protein
MAHAFAADLGNGDFNAALFADDALIFHALVLAAQAFIILDRTKDARAEQAVTLGLERAVVDGFRLLDLAERPAERMRSGEAIPIWIWSKVSGFAIGLAKFINWFIFTPKHSAWG